MNTRAMLERDLSGSIIRVTLFELHMLGACDLLRRLSHRAVARRAGGDDVAFFFSLRLKLLCLAALFQSLE